MRVEKWQHHSETRQGCVVVPPVALNTMGSSRAVVRPVHLTLCRSGDTEAAPSPDSSPHRQLLAVLNGMSPSLVGNLSIGILELNERFFTVGSVVVFDGVIVTFARISSAQSCVAGNLVTSSSNSTMASNLSSLDMTSSHSYRESKNCCFAVSSPTDISMFHVMFRQWVEYANHKADDRWHEYCNAKADDVPDFHCSFSPIQRLFTCQQEEVCRSLISAKLHSNIPLRVHYKRIFIKF
ncbi:hypothetical protein T10_3202 [Trichinella papuae]|uniref:Uncharacterized protein n=1 Tax=Trichinella papuae TaxID=268474 RepID=A0A0V1ME62_9BILA|nr:hypothetical protein T10_3202 [Trichinella papuae]